MERLIIADIRSFCKDGQSEGHYFTVASNYQEIFGQQYEVRVAGGPVYYSHYDKMLKLKYDCSEQNSAIVNKMNTIRNGLKVMREARDAAVVFQCSSVFTIYLCLALCMNKVRVYMIQYDTSSIDSKFKRLLFGLVKHKILGIICPGDEIGKAFGSPYCVVPDYIYSQKEDQIEDVTTVSETYDFGMYGILAKGKGILEAAQFFAKTDYRVMIAGRQGGLPEDEKMIKELKKVCEKNSNIMLSLGYLSEEKYNEYIRNTKYCVLNYSYSYALRSSGVIFDIIFNGKPVLARERKYVEFVKKNGLGVVYGELEDLDMKALMDEHRYSEYLSGIKKYLLQQADDASKLISFISGR